jgi:hypothetical protein
MRAASVHILLGGALLTMVGSLTGCAAPAAPAPQPIVEYRVKEAPGVVEYVWEEPMVDVVDVPPGLDPEGHYYRPGHKEVTEIRQGRWQYYKRPNNK